MDSLLVQADWAAVASMWAGFAVALLVFSLIFGDHVLARLGQYVLVGAALGYAAVVTWHSMATLPFVQALVANPAGESWNWVPVGLALLLALAMLERIFWQGEAGPSPAGWRRWLRWLGLVPAASLVGVAAASVAWGVLQGTLAPQFWRAAQMGVDWQSSPGDFFTGMLMLFLTIAALLFFAVEPRHLVDQPVVARRFMEAWRWLGQRAVWLAAGAIFARLFVSRVSLLAAQVEFFRAVLSSTGVWQAAEALWRRWIGG